MSTQMVSARADEPAKPEAEAAAADETATEAAAAEETPALPTEIATPATDDETPTGLRRSLIAPTAQADAENSDEPESEEDSNIFTKWWFWTAAAVVVGGTIAVGVLASQPGEKQARGCMPGYLCFGDGRE